VSEANDLNQLLEGTYGKPFFALKYFFERTLKVLMFLLIRSEFNNVFFMPIKQLGKSGINNCL